MIPRATVVTVDGPATLREQRSHTERPAWLSRALALYEQTLAEHLAPDGCAPERRAEVDSAIIEARRAFDRAASDGAE